MTGISPAIALASNNLHWNLVQQFMLRHTGNVLRNDQEYLMESRLQRSAKTLGFASVGDFVMAACAAAAPATLTNSMVEALTTHETMFFRDASFWQIMQNQILPPLLERAAKGRSIRIWCAACSTGQEPYSLAMLVRELAPEVLSRFDIIATDIAEPTLQHARSGFYSSLETNRGMDIKRLARHFTQAPGGFRIKDEMRNCITWQQHNLLGLQTDPSNCDVVLCRNVLIYFGETDRSMVLKRLLKATSIDGVFGIGATESCRESNLQTVAPGLYRKLNS